jgi:hypothetical protein
VGVAKRRRAAWAPQALKVEVDFHNNVKFGPHHRHLPNANVFDPSIYHMFVFEYSSFSILE